MVEIFERESLSTPSFGILRISASGVLSPCYNQNLGAEELSVQDLVAITPQDSLTQYPSSLEE